MAEKYLTETDIKKLLQCSRCKRVPANAHIYMCKTGHHECSACYGKYTEGVHLEETDGSTDTDSEFAVSKHTCAACKEQVTNTRNLFAENILARLESMKAEKLTGTPQMKAAIQDGKLQNNYVDCCYNIYGSPCTRYDQNMAVTPYDPQAYSRYPYQCALPQYNYAVEPYLVTESQLPLEFADPNVYYPAYESVTYYASTNKKDVNERRSKISNQGSAVALAGEPSKRPIRCPTHLCGRNIAVAALSHHFCFDHPEVPPLNVDFDVTCQLFIDPEIIPSNHGRCVAMLLIPNKPESMNSMSHSNMINKIKSSLPLVVMASKLDCSTSTPPGIASIHDKDPSPEPLNHGDFQTGNGKSRLLLIWLAGVDTSASLYTTIQVLEKQTNTRSLIYTGPVMSLRASQNTNKIFEQGDCLVIHSGILENIVGDKGGFDLHVVVH